MNQAKMNDDNLLIKASPLREGYNKIVGRGEKGLKLLEFGRLVLTSSEWCGNTDECEMVVDIYAGSLTVEMESASGKVTRFERLGTRQSIFDGQATAVIIPPKTKYRFCPVEGKVDAAVFSSTTTTSDAQASVVKPEDIVYTLVGKGDWQRDVYTVIGNDAPTSRLLVGEVINPGHWSGFPPHKHDTSRPPEIVMEEVYLFQIRPQQGYGGAEWMVHHDGVHANDLGHLVVANRIFEVLAQNCSGLARHTKEIEGKIQCWRDESTLIADYGYTVTIIPEP